MSYLMLDVDQAGELKAAFRRGNWTNAEIKKACEGDFLSRVLSVLRGEREITSPNHVINCDMNPIIPYDGWKVEEHRNCGKVQWDPFRFRLHLSSHQQNGKSINGQKLRKELASELTENAYLLDYLIDHSYLIPEEWKQDENGNTRYIYFWGTVYRHSDGFLCVRCLCFDKGHWRAGYRYLDVGFGDHSPSLVRVR